MNNQYYDHGDEKVIVFYNGPDHVRYAVVGSSREHIVDHDTFERDFKVSDAPEPTDDQIDEDPSLMFNQDVKEAENKAKKAELKTKAANSKVAEAQKTIHDLQSANKQS